MSKTLANELAADNIRQSLAARAHRRSRPRARRDSRQGDRRVAQEVRAMWDKTIPLGRYGKPEEFAAGAVFLFSDAAKLSPARRCRSTAE
jgi:3-oxoacyl-[acyl-carrier protein] reductase